MSAQAYLYPLASGSLGNALLAGAGGTRVLVDAGIGRRRMTAALAAVGLGPRDIDAVFVTHTHGDHFRASAVGFCLAAGAPVYSAAENLAFFERSVRGFEKLTAAGLARPIDGEAVTVGQISVEAFAVPHDAPGVCHGFRLTLGRGRGRRRATVATDLGHLPDGAAGHFLDADAVVLESNHDPAMLRASGRPADLIERIAGPNGHLSNTAAAEALAEVVGRSRPGRMRHVVLAHLSRDCNTARMALEAQAFLARRPGEHLRLFAAAQHTPGPRIGL
jgi:phosphoribosyl 1,2-cyclic phosphodiesterase